MKSFTSKLPDLALPTIVLILALIVAAQYRDARAEEQTAKHAYVYEVCEQARTQSYVITEEDCANVQYQNKVEYLCTARNSSNTNHCWTEDNDQLERY